MPLSPEQCVEPFVFPRVNLAQAAGNIAPFMKSFRIHRPFGGKATWSANFFQYLGDPDDAGNVDLSIPGALTQKFPSDLNPLFGGDGDFAESIRPHDYSTARTIAFDFQFENMSWASPIFLTGRPKFDGEVLQWAGEDKTVLLERDNQKMPDIVADQVPPVIRMAHETIKEICAAYGIPQVDCRFPDYQIRLLRRSGGRPIDWVDLIARPYQALRHWEGDTLVFEPAASVAASANWGFTWDMVESLDIECDDANLKNKFTISRMEAQPSSIGEQECIGYDCIGRTGYIEFDPPSRTAYPEIDVVAGELNDFVFFDENGDPVVNAGSTGGILVSGTAVKHVEFTYEPPTNLSEVGGLLMGTQAAPRTIPWMPRYTVVYKGGGRGATLFEDEFEFEDQDDDSIAQLGERIEHSNIDDPIVPNGEVAQAYLAAILHENVRKVWKMPLKCNFWNPYINPGDIVTITDPATDQEGMRWFVEEIRLGMDESGTFWMELDLTRPVVV